MIETIINDINYRLDEENLTAEVIHMDGYKGDIIIPETVVHESVSYRVTSIEEDAFAYSDLKSIVIPDTVTYIDGGAFEESHLTSVVIPDIVISIEWWAFCGCKSLTDITFQGTIAQWNKIKLRENWKDEVPATVVHCTDGDVEI